MGLSSLQYCLFLELQSETSVLMSSYSILHASPVENIGIFDSLPIRAKLHGFVRIRAKNGEYSYDHHFD